MRETSDLRTKPEAEEPILLRVIAMQLTGITLELAGLAVVGYIFYQIHTVGLAASAETAPAYAVIGAALVMTGFLIGYLLPKTEFVQPNVACSHKGGFREVQQ